MKDIRPQVLVIAVMGFFFAGYLAHLGETGEASAIAMAIIIIGSTLSKQNGE